MSELAFPTALLVSDLKALIQDARSRAARKVNAELSLLYWQVGQRGRGWAWERMEWVKVLKMGWLFKPILD